MLLSNPWDVSFVCLVPDIPALLSYKRYRNFLEIVRKKYRNFTENVQKEKFLYTE